MHPDLDAFRTKLSMEVDQTIPLPVQKNLELIPVVKFWLVDWFLQEWDQN